MVLTEEQKAMIEVKKREAAARRQQKLIADGIGGVVSPQTSPNFTGISIDQDDEANFEGSVDLWGHGDNFYVPEVITAPTPGATPNETLNKIFGYDNFRDGQGEVIDSILSGRDTAVFWATGMGKSLCYQIPALHSGKTAIVISPLISLMQDQCIKLNNICGMEVATFIGSGQSDITKEQRAYNGDYKLVYMTPEKIISSGTLERLSQMANSTNDGCDICLIAIDEAHCISEWGHDFRPAFREMHKIRNVQSLTNIPIMVLTATAVPRVQDDIINQMKLTSPLIASSSMDRTNLRIVIKRKPSSGGVSTALLPLVTDLKTKPRDNSTIIYCPSKKEVDDISSMLSTKLLGICKVAAYHAGMEDSAREASHTGFLTGDIQVIVATVAFGMGIDKPDTRKVYHWGAPKTLEEYYQQIGRAGRDGLPGDVVMYCNPNDFTRYSDDFYTKNLSTSAKRAIAESTEALRKLSLNENECRRVAILRFFDEKPIFGEHCGTCDNCVNAVANVGDTHRNFVEYVRMILTLMLFMKPAPMGVYEKAIKARSVSSLEDWRFQGTMSRNQAEKTFVETINQLPKIIENKLCNPCKDLMPALISEDYVTRTVQPNKGVGRAFDVYTLSTKGRYFLKNNDYNTECYLPVPESIREKEKERNEKKKILLQKLQEGGFDMNTIPATELKEGCGEVIDMYTRFNSSYQMLKEKEPMKAAGLLELKDQIAAWRQRVASNLKMAPTGVLQEHLIYRIALASTSCPLNEEALRSIGVRVGTIQDLISIISKWCTQHKINPLFSNSNGNGNGNGNGLSMNSSGNMKMLLDNFGFRPHSPWQHANYVANRAWEASAQRFTKGESIAVIATSQLKAGKAAKDVLPRTIAGHLLESLKYAIYDINLLRVAEVLLPPTQQEWEQLSSAALNKGLNIASSSDIDKLLLLGGLCPAILIDFNSRDENQQKSVNHWLNCFTWFVALTRADYQPRFAASASASASTSSFSAPAPKRPLPPTVTDSLGKRGWGLPEAASESSSAEPPNKVTRS
jgi:RecQ family ATP-dependent DNA helicase